MRFVFWFRTGFTSLEYCYGSPITAWRGWRTSGSLMHVDLKKECCNFYSEFDRKTDSGSGSESSGVSG